MKEYFRPPFSKESIESTIEAWQPLSKEPLTEADAIEILTNMFGLLNCLANTERGQEIMEGSKKSDPPSGQQEMPTQAESC